MRQTLLLFLLILLYSTAGAQQLTPPAKDSMGVLKSLRLPQNYYSQHLGFFCKKEAQLQKRTSLNVFFRLGSKDYVDYLERKPNARKY